MKTLLLFILNVCYVLSTSSKTKKILYAFKRLKLQNESRGKTMVYNDSSRVTKIFNRYQDLKLAYYEKNRNDQTIVQAEDGSDPNVYAKPELPREVPDLSVNPVYITETKLLSIDEKSINLDYNSRYFIDTRFFFVTEICANFIMFSPIFQRDTHFNTFFCEEFSILIQKDAFYVEYFTTSLRYFGKALRNSVNIYIPKIKTLLDSEIPNFTRDDARNAKLLNENFPNFFEKIYDAIYNSFITFDSLIRLDFDKIKPWTLGMMKLFPQISAEKLNTIIINTLPIKAISQKMYKHLLVHKLKYYQRDLESLDHTNSDFFLLIDEFKLTGQYSGCKIRTTYVTNLYMPDCVDFLKKDSYGEDIIKKCRNTISTFFKSLRERKRLCHYSSVNPDLISSMIEDLLTQMVEMMISKKIISSKDLAASVILKFNKLQFRLSNKAKMLLKLRFVNIHAFNVLYYFKSYLDEPEFELTFQSIMTKYNQLKGKYVFFNNKIKTMLKIEKLKFVRRTHKEKIAKKNMNEKMQGDLSYACILYNENIYHSICTKMFKDARLDFFLKYHTQEFVSHFLIEKVRETLKKYNFFTNKLVKLIIYNHMKFNNVIKEVKDEIMDDIRKIDFNLVDELGKDKIALIIIFAKYFNNDIKLDYNNTVLVALNSAIAARMSQLKKYKYSDYEFFDVLVDIGKDFYNNFQKPTMVNLDNLLKSYIRFSYPLAKIEEEDLLKNLHFLFSHYPTWDAFLRKFYHTNQRTNLNKIINKCKDELKPEDKTVCSRQDTRINLVYKECPLGSSRIGSDTCYSNCPTGFTDLGMYCRKPEFLRLLVMKSKEECGEDCIPYDKTFFIKKCPPAYETFLFYCIPFCPSGGVDYGETCGKTFSGRIKFYY